MADEKSGVHGPTTIEIKELNQSVETTPMFFVDGAQGLAVQEGVVKFNFYQDRLTMPSTPPLTASDPPAMFERVICARLVMTHRTLVQLHSWLGDAVKHMTPVEQKSPDEH